MEHRIKEMGGIKMEEIWKDIKGWEGLYQISNKGRVKSLTKVTKFGNRLKVNKEMILKPTIGKRGYYTVNFFDGDRSKTATLHRLIAEAFIPNPENKPCIDHINTIKTDNRIENLRWVTNKENCNNPLTLKHQRDATSKKWERGCYDNRNNIHYRKVQQFDMSGNLIETYDSIIEASEATGVDRSSISAVCNGRNPNRHTAGGYIWKHLGGHYLKQKDER